MTLAFSTQLNGKPTYFVEKIWQSLLTSNLEFKANELTLKLKEALPLIGSMKIGDYKPKHHTIRTDSKKRWQANKLIHPVINNRTPEHFQFSPVLKCISVQIIEIKHSAEQWRQPWVIIDGKLLTGPQIDQLAINDGFNNTKEFFEYFSEDFKGKIIHWTNLKY